jgi:hypothetical protein
MIDAKSETLVKSVHELLAEKQVVGKKERELVQSLNALLRKMGYVVLPKKRSVRPPGRSRKRRGPGRPRKVGRPKGRRGAPKRRTEGRGLREGGVRREA